METLSPQEQLAEIEERMVAIAERYPDIDYLEVVNEPLHDPPVKRNAEDRGAGNYLEALGGSGDTGWDWVLNSFRMARRHFPDTKLVLNEYSVTNSGESTGRYIDIIRLLQAEDLIDVVAVQAHSFSTTVHADTTRANLDRLAATGLPIQVTEMDIDGTDDAQQLAEYQRIFPVFWEHPAVMGITLWGWRPGMWRGRFGANLMRPDGSPRASMLWLMEYTGRN
jgi:endo-1,4-beta-xylanase